MMLSAAAIKAHVDNLVTNVQDETKHSSFCPGHLWWVLTFNKLTKDKAPLAVSFTEQLEVMEEDMKAAFGCHWSTGVMTFSPDVCTAVYFGCILFITIIDLNDVYNNTHPAISNVVQKGQLDKLPSRLQRDIKMPLYFTRSNVTLFQCTSEDVTVSSELFDLHYLLEHVHTEERNVKGSEKEEC